MNQATSRRAILKAGATAALALTAGTVTSTSAGASATPAGPARTPDRDALQEALDQVVATGGATAALAELRDVSGVWRGASGVAVLGSSRPAPARGRFRIASVTKTFVATVVLQLVGERRVRLDDTIERWLPGIVPNSHRITVRQLLQHTSGVYDYLEVLLTRVIPTLEEYVRRRFDTWQARDLVALAAAEPPLFEPGTSWSYSNTNYLLLGLVIERVTGRSYGAEVTRRIVQPLGLRGTRVPGTSPEINGPHAHGYELLQPGDLQPVDITGINPSVAGAAGEMISTTADLNRFLRALLGGRLLRPTQLDQMLANPVDPEQYGLGIFRIPIPHGTPIWGHTGNIFGYETFAATTEDGRRQVTLSVSSFIGDRGATIESFLTLAFCGIAMATNLRLPPAAMRIPSAIRLASSPTSRRW
jgi:D-alanyl-D-alanine carboxypeptidase